MQEKMIGILSKVTPEHAEELNSLIDGSPVILKRLLDDYGLRSLDDLSERYFEEAKNRIMLINEIRAKGINISKRAHSGPKTPMY